jgi:hypothetical protein
MNALIGMDESVKLVLLSLDDDAKPPTKSQLRRFFPEGKVNIYKAYGHHSTSIWGLECIFNIAKNGSKTHNYFNRQKIITHVIRLDSNTEVNEFFTLTYSNFIVGIVKITEQCIEKAELLIKAISEANQQISSITMCKDRIYSTKNFFENMRIDDPKISNPNEESIASLFDNYGDIAHEQMTTFVKKWLDNRLCN